MEFLDMFDSWEDIVEYEAGTVIFLENDPADVLYVILSGEVELTIRGDVLGSELKGGLIGEMSLLESATCNTTAKTLCNTTLARIRREQLTSLAGRNSDFSFHMMTVLATRLREVDVFLTSRLSQSG